MHIPGALKLFSFLGIQMVAGGTSDLSGSHAGSCALEIPWV